MVLIKRQEMWDEMRIRKEKTSLKWLKKRKEWIIKNGAFSFYALFEKET